MLIKRTIGQKKVARGNQVAICLEGATLPVILMTELIWFCHCCCCLYICLLLFYFKSVFFLTTPIASLLLYLPVHIVRNLLLIYNLGVLKATFYIWDFDEHCFLALVFTFCGISWWYIYVLVILLLSLHFAKLN